MAKKVADYTKTDGSIAEKRFPRPAIGSKWINKRTNVIIKVAPHQFFTSVMFEGDDIILDLSEFYHDYTKVGNNG